jgi:hypothetical protein
LEQQLVRKQREVVLAQEQLREMSTLSHNVNDNDMLYLINFFD